MRKRRVNPKKVKRSGDKTPLAPTEGTGLSPRSFLSSPDALLLPPRPFTGSSCREGLSQSHRDDNINILLGGGDALDIDD